MFLTLMLGLSYSLDGDQHGGRPGSWRSSPSSTAGARCLLCLCSRVLSGGYQVGIEGREMMRQQGPMVGR